MMHTQSGTSESKENAGRAGRLPRGRFVLGAAGLASVIGECMGWDSRAMRKAIAGAALLLCSVGPVAAQQAAWDDGSDTVPAAQPVSSLQTASVSPASVLAGAPVAASDDIPVLHYSDDKHTNARLNAVFDLIATQGDGMVWDSAHHPAQPKPVSVASAVTVGGPLPGFASAGSAATTSPASGTAAASAPIVASAPIATPATAPQTWAFASSGSLQDTLTAWAQEAGWKTPTWQASQPYKITSTQPLAGSFMDALRAVADAEPEIDIDVSETDHTLTIVDHKKM